MSKAQSELMLERLSSCSSILLVQYYRYHSVYCCCRRLIAFLFIKINLHRAPFVTASMTVAHLDKLVSDSF